MTTTESAAIADNAPGTLPLFGAGKLYAALLRHGAGDAGFPIAVVATDTWDTSSYPDIQRHSRERAMPWLPVRAELGRVVIGPLEQADVPGCTHCFELRRRRAWPHAAAREEILTQFGADLAARPTSWLTGLACDTVATLVVEEAARFQRDPSSARTRDAVLYVGLAELSVTQHRFLPEPLCPACGRLPDDSAERAVLTLASRPKLDPNTPRVRKVHTELDGLLKSYVDSEAGLIRSLHRDDSGGLAVAVASVPMRTGRHIEPGCGRSRNYRSSELIAVLESLERWGGIQPGGKSTATQASYAELGGRALDPRTLGVHPDESYQQEDFPFRPFSEDAICRWVWGYSFARREPILVPETYAYYRTPRSTPERQAFLYETSNGCALGSGIEEAVLHGILEVAERDAFLLTWYCRLPAPRIDLNAAVNRQVPLQANEISRETGYRVLAFDTTVETGIPSAWAMAICPDDAPNRPKVVCSAGSHLNLESAVLNALSELGPIMADVARRFPDEAEAARRMIAEPSLVRTMQDHSTLYGAYQAVDRFDFLLDSPNQRDSASAQPAFAHDDLRDDLTEAINRYLTRGMDVIVVDQTTPEHQVGGFCCVKVLIPGTLSMTFGHRNRRTEGLPRLHTMPQLLGYRDDPLPHDALNPHPHPFP